VKRGEPKTTPARATFAPTRIVARFIRLVREAKIIGEGADAHPMTHKELSTEIIRLTGKPIDQPRLSKLEHGKAAITSDTAEAIAIGLGLSALEFYARGVELCRAEDAAAG
jgi:transcriptional regulator with XRE-family HTH domain